MGVWFSIFPTAETLGSQLLAAILVIGCYFAPRFRPAKLRQNGEPAFQDLPAPLVGAPEPQFAHSVK
jgi:hypothetical protein